jgi:hypothetical protein
MRTQLGLQQTSPETQTHGPPAAENTQGVVSLQDFAVNHLKLKLSNCWIPYTYTGWPTLLVRVGYRLPDSQLVSHRQMSYGMLNM